MDYLLIQVNPYEEIIGLYLSNLGKSANDLPRSQAANAKLLEVTIFTIFFSEKLLLLLLLNNAFYSSPVHNVK